MNDKNDPEHFINALPKQSILTNDPWKILIVDDDEDVHLVTKMALHGKIKCRRSVTFLSAYSAKEAKEIFKENQDITMILLDVIMETEHAGLDLVDYIRNELKNRLVRIVLRTGQSGKFPEAQLLVRYDLNGYLSKTLTDSQMLINTVLISLRNYQDLADCKYARESVVTTQSEIIALLCGIVEFRSKETGAHIGRVSELSYNICIESGYAENFCSVVRQAAPLHDIGKVAIPDAILDKPGRLTEDEYQIMRCHSRLGEEMLSNSINPTPTILSGALIAGSHHESWDGTGYPNGLKGKSIPLEGRIVAIADVFDALTSKRVYKSQWDKEKALKYMKDNAGKRFDPNLIDAFIILENKKD